MYVGFYLFVRKEFFRVGGVEYAASLEPEDIIVLPAYDAALKSLSSSLDRYTNQGYHLNCSGNGSGDSPILYWCRYENSQEKAVVFEIQYRELKGDLVTI